MEVRPATTADAVALARVHAAAWKFAYPGIMADDFLDQIDESRWARGWERNLEEGAAVTLVGTTADGQVNGFASVGAPQDPDAPASGQLWAINLHPSAIGTGLGKVLHDAALEALRDSGHGSTYLWVAEANGRARHFYEREGWMPDGVAREEEIGGAAVREVRYVRTLS